MLRRVTLVRTDILEELSASVIRVTRVGELGMLSSSETSALMRAPRRNIAEDAVLQYLYIFKRKVKLMKTLIAFNQADFEELTISYIIINYT
jgi:hypothetical protein